MARPLSYSPEHGSYLTLGDLEDFLREARRTFPERQQVRVQPAVELNLAHGPRGVRITVVPEEVTDDGA